MFLCAGSAARALSALVIAVSVLQVAAQGGSTSFKNEAGPDLNIEECTMSGCQKMKKKVTLDANWRWVHKKGSYRNCYTGNQWDSEYCPEGEAGAKTCAETCAIEGVDAGEYKTTYGIEGLKNGDGISMHFVNKHKYGTSVGARVYVLDSQDKYYMWKLKNREFTFTADISEIECGMNGAVYFIEMDESGNKG